MVLCLAVLTSAQPSLLPLVELGDIHRSNHTRTSP
jgi:hypothetical protein